VVAWACGSLVGLLCSATTIYTGPLAGIAGGVDLSFVAGMVTAAVAYLAIRAVFPESKRDAVPARAASSRPR
jgi:purine-cytosine permease-like protein